MQGARFNGGVSGRRAKRSRQKPNGIILPTTTSPRGNKQRGSNSDDERTKKGAKPEDDAEWYEESFMLSSISETSLSDSEWSEWDDDPVWVEDPLLLYRNQLQTKHEVQLQKGAATPATAETNATAASKKKGGEGKKKGKKKKGERSKAKEATKNENDGEERAKATKAKTKTKAAKKNKGGDGSSTKKEKGEQGAGHEGEEHRGQAAAEHQPGGNREGDTEHVGGRSSTAPIETISEETSDATSPRSEVASPVLSPSQSPRSRMAAAWGQKRTSVREACDAWESRLAMATGGVSPHANLSQSDRAAFLRRPASPPPDFKRSHTSLLLSAHSQDRAGVRDKKQGEAAKDTPEGKRSAQNSGVSLHGSDAKKLVLPLSSAMSTPSTPKEQKTKQKEKEKQSEKKDKEKRKQEKADRKKAKSEMKKKKSRSMDVIEELKQRQEVQKLIRVRSEEDEYYFGSSITVTTTVGIRKGGSREQFEDDEYLKFLDGTVSRAPGAIAREGRPSSFFTEPATDRRHRDVKPSGGSLIMPGENVGRSYSVREMKREKKGIRGLLSGSHHTESPSKSKS